MLWTLLQAGKKEQACEEVKSGRLADAKTLGYQVNDQGLVFPHPICMVRYQCSSDTMDPLGAKGSERRHGGSVLSLGRGPCGTVPKLSQCFRADRWCIVSTRCAPVAQLDRASAF